MTKEREKAVYDFNPNMRYIKMTMIIMFICVVIIVTNSCLSIYNLKPDGFDNLLLPLSGYFILFAFSGANFLSDRNVRESFSKNNGNTSFLDIYPVIPVTRKYLMQQEFKYWKYTAIFTSIALIATNIVYFSNPVLKTIPGYCVFITLTTSLAKLFQFAAKFHRKKWGEIGLMAFAIAYIVIIILSTVTLFKDLTNIFLIKLLKCRILEPLAGIPMLIVSFSLVPIIFFIYYRFTIKAKKADAWYSN